MGSYTRRLNELAEDFVFIAFVCSLGFLYAACLRALWFAFKAGWRNYKFKKLEIVCFCLGIAGLCCFAYGLYEPFVLEVSDVQIKSDKVQREDSPFRIVHITDIHSDGIDRLEKRLPGEVAALKPDLVVFTGDSANNKSGLATFRKCITEIAKVAPTYAVYGNHDSRGGRFWDIYGQTGVHVLNGSSETFSIKGTKVWISGVAVDNEGALSKALQDVPSDAFSVFLYHYPAGIDAASLKNIDLFCAGHTHGGQVRLPIYGALVTNSTKGKQYEAGLYEVGRTRMYISRGIGMIGIPVRFLAPPEVAVINVNPQ